MKQECDEKNSFFSADEWLRYTRHIQLPHIGPEGQTKLKQSHALVIGAGGLGSPVSLYLAAAGVGHITLVDNDSVELTNLQRQILFSQRNIKENKAKAGANNLRALNSEIHVHAVPEGFSQSNAEQLVKEADIVLDCTDNFATRYLINDSCLKLKTTWVFASIHQYSGQCSLFSKNTGCFRCLFPETPETMEDCNTAGVIGVLPGLVGTFQANEALKYLCGLETPLEGQLLLFNALSIDLQKIKLSRSPDCICCAKSNNEKPILLEKNEGFGCKLEELEISASNFFAQKKRNQYRLLDVRSLQERLAFNIGGEHWPLDTIQDHTTKLSAGDNIVCYCQSGKRSLQAATLLTKLGFNARSVQGGLPMIISHPEFKNQT